MSASSDACIFSRVTGPGSAAIAVLLLDGGDVVTRFGKVFTAKRKVLDPRSTGPHFGRIVDGSGNTIDEVVATPLFPQDTPTGNPQIELACHGGEGVVAAVEFTLLECGFARAGGTELLERSHLNGKLSLMALEARTRLAQAVTARQAEFLLGHAALQERWERLGFEMALGLREKRADWRATIIDAASDALAAAKSAIALLSVQTIAIVGPVNAGKSTLANALARAERHIVSAIPGTTRDRLDTPLDIRGLHVLLSDTAGLRAAGDAIEEEGQKRALAAAHAATLRIALIDGSTAPSDADISFLKTMIAAGPTLVVLNKKDLKIDDTAAGLGFVVGEEPLAISAQSGEGLEDLEAQLESRLLGPDAAGALSAGAPFTPRQVARLEALREGLQSDAHGMDVIIHLRKLVGTRPDAEELAAALAPLAEAGSYPTQPVP